MKRFLIVVITLVGTVLFNFSPAAHASTHHTGQEVTANGKQMGG